MVNRQPKQIVAITHSDDAHLPFVQAHLDTQIIVIDHEKITRGTPASISFLNDMPSEAEMRYGTHILSNVRSVWMRKPLPLSEYYQRYARFSLQQFSNLLYSRFPRALWVSDFYAINKASDKVLQLELARKLGFNVPDTIITSSSDSAKQFMQSHDTVITKPIQCETGGLQTWMTQLTTRLASCRLTSQKNAYSMFVN